MAEDFASKLGLVAPSSGGGDFASKLGLVKVEPKPEQPGVFGKIWGDIKGAGQRLATDVMAEPDKPSNPLDISAATAKGGRILKDVANIPATLIGSPIRHLISEPISAAGKAVLPGKVGKAFPSPDDIDLALSAAKGGPLSGGPRTAAKLAVDAGYRLPPAMTKDSPGLTTNILSGWGGKIKLQQAASVKNQEVTNGLAAKALGLPDDTTLTAAEFKRVRTDAGRDYAAIAQALPTSVADGTFQTTVSALGSRQSQAAAVFPQLMQNPEIEKLVSTLSSVPQFPTQAGLDLVRELRFNANSNLKAIGDPQKHALGLAQREAAEAIDSLIERNVMATAQTSPNVPTDLIDKYRAARRLIAKSYDIEGATNPATGDVNAQGLARLAMKGRPLTDELKTIADAANAFPKAMQRPQGFGGNEAHSGLDFFGSALALAHGNPSIAAAILGRPIARGTVLSRPFQKGLVSQPWDLSGATPAFAAPAVSDIASQVPGQQ